MALKDIAYELRSAYIALLEGSVTVDGFVVPFYDVFVPKTAPKYFVVVKEIYFADDSLKCGHAGDVHSVFDVVTEFRPGEGTSRISEMISGQIKSLLVPNTITLPNFNITNTILVIDKPLSTETSTERIINKILTFKNTVQQIN